MFGAIRSEVGTSDNPRKFTGKEYESDVKLYYFARRYYDPYIGRFTQRDPIRDGINWYAYARNNPLAFIDPTGLRAMDRRERNRAKPIFGNMNIDLDAVNIRSNTPFARFSYRRDGAITTGNSIHGRNMSADLLVHELVHVWQYQHGLIEPLSAGAANIIIGGAGWISGQKFNDALYGYNVDSIHDPNRRHFREYDFEQQAAIIQDAYVFLEMHEDATDPKDAKPWIQNASDFSAYELRDVYEQFVREFQEWDRELTRQRTYDATGRSQSQY